MLILIGMNIKNRWFRVTGDSYKSWKMGPVPEQYMTIIDSPQSSDKLTITQEGGDNGYSPTEVFTALKT